MRVVSLTAGAREELVEAIRWYESRQAGLGAAFYGEIIEVLTRIGEMPAQFPFWERRPVLRKAVLSVTFPYVVYFREQPQGIEVVAVAHGSRAPGYWRRRP